MRAETAVILILSLTGGMRAFGAEETTQARDAKTFGFIREGFVLDGVEGTVTRSPAGDRWLFAADDDISDGRGVIKAGCKTELLPSGTLEKIEAQINRGRASTDVRLWAIFTRYSNRHRLGGTGRDKPSDDKEFFDRNFLFVWYFIPMSAAESRPDEIEDETEDQRKAEATDEEDSIIPDDVMAMLKPKRMVNLARLKKLDIEGDMMLADRTGFIVSDETGRSFKLDGLGRNVEDVSFRLLESEVLERVEADLAYSPYRQRYRAAGRITKYNGGFYMLLQRAVRTYSHGNFAR
ncbi:MAG TPA: hypothetical protein HPP87_01360 [Planctomycetes bacterium]|nr:hypothetical protein [Planctomycetota bacterium]HIJ69992.1 hypothetical protein [Planctomycetota bacterium]